MKRVLLIKVSSMGDIIHTLPAVTEAAKKADVQFDWVVDPAFMEIPLWNQAVNRIIEYPLRRWKKNIFQALRSGEVKLFYKNIKSTNYDLVIDAQGLLKTAWMSKVIKAPTYGLDKHSAKEPWSHLFYDHPLSVSWNDHAVERTRHLFSKSLGYDLDHEAFDYGISLKKSTINMDLDLESYVVFVHGTSNIAKLWSEAYWVQLGHKLNEKGLTIALPWGNSVEKQRAERIASGCKKAIVLPKLTLTQIAWLIKNSKFIVAMDTGLAHLSAALSAPCVSLYQITDPKKIGAYGKNQYHLMATKRKPITLQEILAVINQSLYSTHEH